jgi:hypothetical protein
VHARPRSEAPSAQPAHPAQARAGPAASYVPALRLAGIGNRAVARLVRSLQRAPDYTKPVADVEGTGITRLEVHGLQYGVEGFRSSYGGIDSDETNKTSEDPTKMAVVLVPDSLDPAQPVQVILHFHGWGFRFNADAHDPYAGYLVAKGGRGRPAAGTVRDVDQEHWEQQIGGLKGQGPQIVAVLAQGRGKSFFGDFPTFDYVQDVLMKSGRKELLKLAADRKYAVVLSAHSGGGSRVAGTILAPGADAESADRTPLVVLYEAINGPGDLGNVMTWVDRQLDRLGAALAKTPDKAADALKATPVLRGYYGKRDSGYAVKYCELACRIRKSIDAKIPTQWRQDAADRFRVIEVAGPGGAEVGHERVISGTGATASSGSLADSLRAQRDPKVDRAQEVSCDGCLAAIKARQRAKAKVPAKT